MKIAIITGDGPLHWHLCVELQKTQDVVAIIHPHLPVQGTQNRLLHHAKMLLQPDLAIQKVREKLEQQKKSIKRNVKKYGLGHTALAWVDQYTSALKRPSEQQQAAFFVGV
ncbi:MAG: hypothetical protein V1754_14835, partial [Pseudomonadota bacterium]